MDINQVSEFVSGHYMGLGIGVAVMAVAFYCMNKANGSSPTTATAPEKPKEETPKPTSAPTAKPEMPALRPTAPHDVVNDTLHAASSAIQTAKDVSTPEAPDHVKEAAKTLTDAAVTALKSVKPMADAVIATVNTPKEGVKMAPQDVAKAINDWQASQAKQLQMQKPFEFKTVALNAVGMQESQKDAPKEEKKD